MVRCLLLLPELLVCQPPGVWRRVPEIETCQTDKTPFNAFKKITDNLMKDILQRFGQEKLEILLIGIISHVETSGFILRKNNVLSHADDFSESTKLSVHLSLRFIQSDSN